MREVSSPTYQAVKVEGPSFPTSRASQFFEVEFTEGDFCGLEARRSKKIRIDGFRCGENFFPPSKTQGLDFDDTKPNNAHRK